MKRFKVNNGFELRHNGSVYKEGSFVMLSDKDSDYLLRTGLLSLVEPKALPEPVKKEVVKKEVVEEKPKKAPAKKATAKKATTKKKTTKKEK
jgi:hypothetical protein